MLPLATNDGAPAALAATRAAAPASGSAGAAAGTGARHPGAGPAGAPGPAAALPRARCTGTGIDVSVVVRIFSSGRCCGPSGSPPHKSTARSITLRSSRMLPGQLYRHSTSSASRVSGGWLSMLIWRAACDANARASPGISEVRSLSGGMTRVAPLRRKNRSWRNVPRVISLSRSRLVAAMKRTSSGRGLSPPTRSTTRSSMTRSSLTWIEWGSSPTSSRNTVPPSAVSSRPGLAAIAPVNAPRSWPNSSLSSRLSDSAAQLSLRYGLAARGDMRWTRSASTSLPTPVSPRIRTVMLPAAMRSARL